MGVLYQYYRDEPILKKVGAVVDFTDNDTSDSFNFKEEITGNDSTKDVEILVPLRYLSNFWRTIKMSLINCENKFILTWSANCFMSSNTATDQATTFAATEKKNFMILL